MNKIYSITLYYDNDYLDAEILDIIYFSTLEKAQDAFNKIYMDLDAHKNIKDELDGSPRLQTFWITIDKDQKSYYYEIDEIQLDNKHSPISIL